MSREDGDEASQSQGRSHWPISHLKRVSPCSWRCTQDSRGPDSPVPTWCCGHSAILPVRGSSIQQKCYCKCTVEEFVLNWIWNVRRVACSSCWWSMVYLQVSVTKIFYSLIICKYLHAVKCCAFVSHAGFLLSNVYCSPRESAESVAVTRADNFVRGGKLPSLADRFLWRVSQGQPAAAHRYRYAFDICRPRRSGIKSKTPPVGFHKKPDSWIICGGLNVAMSCTTLSFLLEGLYQPTSVFLSLQAQWAAAMLLCSASYLQLLPASEQLLLWLAHSKQAPVKKGLEKGRRNWEKLEERESWTWEDRLRSPLDFFFQK